MAHMCMPLITSAVVPESEQQLHVDVPDSEQLHADMCLRCMACKSREHARVDICQHACQRIPWESWLLIMREVLIKCKDQDES